MVGPSRGIQHGDSVDPFDEKRLKAARADQVDQRGPRGGMRLGI